MTPGPAFAVLRAGKPGEPLCHGTAQALGEHLVGQIQPCFLSVLDVGKCLDLGPQTPCLPKC